MGSIDDFGLDPATLLAQRGWLRALARGLVGAGEVDDVVQESWLAALRAKARPRSSVRGWLAGLARNAARRNARDARATVDSADVVDGRAGEAELLARAELQERVIAAVRALREPYRSTVLLHYFEGLSLEQVARRMTVPGSTARTRLARAHAELRGRLAGERDGDAWALLLGLARGSGVALPSQVLGVLTMSAVIKIVAGVAAVGAVGLVLWTRGHAPSARGASAPAIDTPPQLDGSTRDEGSAPSETDAKAVGAPAAPSAIGSERSEVASSGAATELAPGASTLARSLDTVADTFLTAEPDVAGLLAVAADLALSAEVLPDTIEVDAGRITGELAPDGLLRGTFEIDGDDYRVELVTTLPRPPFFQRDLTLTFSAAPGSSAGHATVQFHPKTSENAASVLGTEEQLVGWVLGVDATEGTRARPMTMRAEGRSWIIGGASDAFAPRTLPWASGTQSFDAWLTVLRPYRR